MGIIQGLLSDAGLSVSAISEACAYIAQKNTHDLQALCRRCGVSEDLPPWLRFTALW